MASTNDLPQDTKHDVMMPSELYGENAQAHVGTPAQQGAPEPGSGTTVHEGGKVPMKDQAIGYAKSIRGTVFNQPETKATGEKIIHGEISAKQYFEQKKADKDTD